MKTSQKYSKNTSTLHKISPRNAPNYMCDLDPLSKHIMSVQSYTKATLTVQLDQLFHGKKS